MNQSMTRRLAADVMFIVTALAISSIANAANGPVVKGERGQRLDAWMQSMEHFGMHGAILVEQDGEIILQNGYGLADHQGERPITDQTVMDVGSVAKQFTATAILTLQASGKLDVNDTIDAHLPDIPDDKKQITIHQLLCHTSGLSYHQGAESVLASPLAFEPGSRWSYSNTGYQLLGRIVERVSGKVYADYVRDVLFEPAGMARTCCVGARPWPYPDCAHSYTDDTDQGSLAIKTVGFADVGPGGIATCVGDLYLWEQALRNNTVLSPDLTDLLFREHARNPGSTVGYGYGWMVLDTIRGTKLVLHQGNYGGYNADFRRYVDEGLTIIFLSNHFVQGKSMRDAVVNRVSMLINGGDVPNPPVVMPVNDRVRGSHIGIYNSDAGVFDVRAVPGGVAITPDGQLTMNMVFAPERDDAANAFIESCRDRTDQLFSHVFADEKDSCRSMIAPGLPFEGAWSMLRGVAAELEAAHGSFAGSTVIGSALAADGVNARTYVTLQLERGSTLAQLTWTQRGVLHFARVESLPGRRFLATGPNRYTAFDIFSGQRVDIEFKDAAMTIRSDDGSLVGTAFRQG